MADSICKDNPLWEVLYKIWTEQGKPGYINHGEILYRVLQPSDNDIRFASQGGSEMLYESRSTRGLSQ
jgi:hypothetical protein